MSRARRTLRVFEGYGIEVEYMIVDRTTLDVRPLAEVLLETLETGPARRAARGSSIVWSNELVAHVLEAKCERPARSLVRLLAPWRQAVGEVDRALAPLGAGLLPAAVHPWMQPAVDARLWRGEGHEIYAEYDRIFGCRSHGWTNLQSVHLNLPFGDDEEFARLHAAVRVVLPLIPALAAASPYLDGRFTGLLDARMEAYRVNSLKIPAMTGPLIPEPVTSEADYRARILDPLYRATAPHDPRGILHDEWANARAAIARFDRRAIEIRVIDSQECPVADLAIAHAVAATVRAAYEGCWVPAEALREWDTESLRALFLDAVRDADQAQVRSPDYARLWGWRATDGPPTFGDLWRHLLTQPALRHPRRFAPYYRLWARRGPLARRMLTAAGRQPSRDDLATLLRSLRHALLTDSPFDPARPPAPDAAETA